MSKRTVATNWEIIGSDETGAMVSIDYVCPYCKYPVAELIGIGGNNVDKLGSCWETDQVCAVCGKNVIVECRK